MEIANTRCVSKIESDAYIRALDLMSTYPKTKKTYANSLTFSKNSSVVGSATRSEKTAAKKKIIKGPTAPATKALKHPIKIPKCFLGPEPKLNTCRMVATFPVVDESSPEIVVKKDVVVSSCESCKVSISGVAVVVVGGAGGGFSKSFSFSSTTSGGSSFGLL